PGVEGKPVVMGIYALPDARHVLLRSIPRSQAMDRLGWLSYANPIAIFTVFIVVWLHPGVNHDRLRSNHPKPRFAMAIWISFATPFSWCFMTLIYILWQHISVSADILYSHKVRSISIAVCL